MTVIRSEVAVVFHPVLTTVSIMAPVTSSWLELSGASLGNAKEGPPAENIP